MPALLDRTFAAVVLDWDGTAVPDRASDASAVNRRLLALCRTGVDVAVVTGTSLAVLGRQLTCRAAGPGRLFAATDRGGSLHRIGTEPVQLRTHPVTDVDISALHDGATATLGWLRERGLESELVVRPNRRKLDLIPSWPNPLKSEIAQLEAAVLDRLRRCGIGSVGEVVEHLTREARASGAASVRVTSDAKHVELGVTDKGDAVRELLELLEDDGVGPGLVLVVGDEFGPLGGVLGSDARMLAADPRLAAVSVGVEPHGTPGGVVHVGGGPAMLLRILDDQLARAAALRVPALDPDPRWVVSEGPDPLRQRVVESLLTLSSGGVAARGSVEENGPGSIPSLLAEGVYTGPSVEDELLRGPDPWAVTVLDPPRRDVRTLDLRTGVLVREEMDGPAPYRSARFASLREPRVFLERVEAGGDRLAWSGPREGWSESSCPRGGGIGVLSRVARSRVGAVDTVEVVAAVDASRRGRADPGAARSRLKRATRTGFDRLLVEQRRAWARRWQVAGVELPDAPSDELAVRMALFELWGLVGGSGDLPVGARGLTGQGYSGHVFWDADIFVLPALTTLDPDSARRMVEYRIAHLDQARARARSAGREGARYPWESALTGEDVTPTRGRLGGEDVAILTGTMEEGI